MTKSFMRSASIIALSVMASGLGVSAPGAALAKAAATPVTVNTQTVTQDGNGNTITIDQVNAKASEAKIKQMGDTNTAKITQSGQGDFGFSQVVGSNNTVTQTFGVGANNTATNNNSQVYQCVTASCDLNAVVKPTGNTATTNLTGTNQASYIVQAGNNNQATATLSGDGGAGTDANAQIEQYSDYNSATATQTSTTTGFAKIIQGVTTAGAAPRGSKFSASAGYTTSTSTPVTSKGNVGAFNVATTSQNIDATNGSANIYQGADFNEAHATQKGADQFVEIRQDGATGSDTYGNNLANVTQELGGNGASAFVLQNGQSNQVSLTQSAMNVSADLAQYGNKNVLTLTQTVAGATAKLTQTGNSNTLTMKQ